MAQMDIGLIGLAVMGENLVLNMESKGFGVAVFNRTVSKVDDFMNGRGKGKNFLGCHSIEELCANLKRPRKVMLLVKAGKAVDDFIELILPYLEPGDIIIDGGNSHFPDTIRRAQYVESKGFLYIGTGVSGGEEGALLGPSMMPGGSPAAWPHVKEVFQAVCAKTPEGEPCCDWVGEGGAGHFVKMVHNGIEYGDMQMICETYHLMRHGLGMSNEEMHEVFVEWNQGELDSYLIEITRDAEFLPPFYVQSNLDPGATICSDWPYSNLPPDGLLGIFDIFQDVALGRIPVDTLDEANLVVDKIINYEKTPPLQHGFYQKATVASQFQCCRTDVDWAHRGSDQAAFVEPSEVCRDAMVNAGYAVDRIYAKTVDGGDPSASPPIPGYTGDATPRFYWDGTAIPADIGPGSGFAWDGDATDVVNAWNEGRFLMIHVDHGYPGGWGTPGFNWNQVTYDLNSSNLTPVLFSINCSSGYYDNEIVGEAADYSQMYFTERLLRFPGRAVAVFSSSRTSWIWENSFQIKGWIDALFPNTLPGFGDGASHHRLGDIFVHGDIYMLSQINVSFDAAHAGDQIHMYHLFGDPTMEIWTKYPYTFQFPSNIGLTIVNGVLDVNYAADGAVVTAFGHSLQGERIPVGRGSIEGGHATLFIENPPRDGELLDISVGLPDAISTELQVQVPDITPPAGVYRFFRHRVESGYQLTWINPADSDFAGVRIQRKVGSYPLSVDDGENVFEGNGESLMDDGYVAGVPDYYYTAFAHDAVPNYAPGVNAEIGQ